MGDQKIIDHEIRALFAQFSERIGPQFPELKIQTEDHSNEHSGHVWTLVFVDAADITKELIVVTVLKSGGHKGGWEIDVMNSTNFVLGDRTSSTALSADTLDAVLAEMTEFLDEFEGDVVQELRSRC